MCTWLHAALVLISKQAHLLTTAHAVNTVQFKVNDTEPYRLKLLWDRGEVLSSLDKKVPE